MITERYFFVIFMNSVKIFFIFLSTYQTVNKWCSEVLNYFVLVGTNIFYRIHDAEAFSAIIDVS